MIVMHKYYSQPYCLYYLIFNIILSHIVYIMSFLLFLAVIFCLYYILNSNFYCNTELYCATFNNIIINIQIGLSRNLLIRIGRKYRYYDRLDESF